MANRSDIELSTRLKRTVAVSSVDALPLASRILVALFATVLLYVDSVAAEVTSGDELQEILVTAEKRGAENLLQVPVPVGVINTDQLGQLGQVRLQDYFEQVPGLVVAPSAVNQTNISIRGIVTVGTPTVGVMIDDVPFGSSTETYIPELDPGDLARVEVLRGPQGTLYGSDSMGGLIDYVTIAPSTERVSGQVSAGTESIHNGSGYGMNVRGSVNIPITDTFAIRASAFRRQDPGYIYNTLTNDTRNNEAEAEGARIAALWRPNDWFSAKLSALYQELNSRGSDEVDLSLRDLQTSSARDSERDLSTPRNAVQNYSAVVSANLGSFQLTSLSGYNSASERGTRDFSNIFGGLLAHFFNVAPYGVITIQPDFNKFSQELRVGTSIAKWLDIQIGGFYTHENLVNHANLFAVNPYTGQRVIPVNAFYNYYAPYTLNEYAGFANLTYHFSERFDIQVGGRAVHLDQVFDQFDRYGSLNTPNPISIPRTEAKSKPVTYLVTPRFFVTPDIMIYARGASGYRPGGTNTAAGVPLQFSPDKTYTYELGTKGKFLDNRLTADFSLYYVSWKDIQILLLSPIQQRYNGNGGAAKSEGVELTVTAKPFRGSSISGWLDYDDAVLTSSFGNSPTYGQPGNRLPFAPKLSGNISARQDFPLPNSVTGFVALDVSFTGNRIGDFQSDPTRQVYPSFTQTNLQAGINYEGWTANLFVNNVADIRGQLNGGIGYPGVNNSTFVLIQPRTIGVSFTRKF